MKNKKVQIVVNKHNVKHNLTAEEKRPVISLQRSGRPTEWTNEITFISSSGEVICKLIYQPDCALHCGATVYFETTDNNIRYEGELAEGRTR